MPIIPDHATAEVGSSFAHDVSKAFKEAEMVIRYPEMFPPTSEDIARTILSIPDSKEGGPRRASGRP